MNPLLKVDGHLSKLEGLDTNSGTEQGDHKKVGWNRKGGLFYYSKCVLFQLVLEDC